MQTLKSKPRLLKQHSSLYCRLSWRVRNARRVHNAVCNLRAGLLPLSDTQQTSFTEAAVTSTREPAP